MKFNWIEVLKKQFGDTDNDRIRRANEVMVFNPIQLGIGVTAELKTEPTNPRYLLSKEGQVYRTTITVAVSHCTCADHKSRHVPCKHLIRLANLMNTMDLDIDIDPLPIAYIDRHGDFEVADAATGLTRSHDGTIVIGTEYKVKPVTVVTSYEVQ